MSLPGGAGTAVFEYEAAPSDLQKQIAAAVNRAAGSLSDAQKEMVLADHKRVFEFNNSIIADFEVGCCAVSEKSCLGPPTFADVAHMRDGRVAASTCTQPLEALTTQGPRNERIGRDLLLC